MTQGFIKCSYCDKSCKTTDGGLKNHLRKVHFEEYINLIQDETKHHLFCSLCKGSFKTIGGLSSHITLSHKEYTLKDYYLKFIDSEAGKCETCGKETTFRGLKDKFSSFCSQSCKGKCIRIQEKTKKKIKEVYGKHPINSKESISKSQQTKIERFKDIEYKKKITDKVKILLN